MKYSISEAARVAGVTRKTFYKHIDKKPISFEEDDNGNKLIDASELIRVYGDKCKFEGQGQKGETPKSKQVSTEVSIEEAIEKKVLEKENELLREKLVMLEERVDRESGLLDNANTALDKSLENQRLIDDKSHREGGLEKTMKALEERIANQEKSAEEKEKALLLEKQDLEKHNKWIMIVSGLTVLVVILASLYKQGIFSLFVP